MDDYHNYLVASYNPQVLPLHSNNILTQNQHACRIIQMSYLTCVLLTVTQNRDILSMKSFQNPCTSSFYKTGLMTEWRGYLYLADGDFCSSTYSPNTSYKAKMTHDIAAFLSNPPAAAPPEDPSTTATKLGLLYKCVGASKFLKLLALGYLHKFWLKRTQQVFLDTLWFGKSHRLFELVIHVASNMKQNEKSGTSEKWVTKCIGCVSCESIVACINEEIRWGTTQLSGKNHVSLHFLRRLCQLIFQCADQKHSSSSSYLFETLFLPFVNEYSGLSNLVASGFVLFCRLYKQQDDTWLQTIDNEIKKFRVKHATLLTNSIIDANTVPLQTFGPNLCAMNVFQIKCLSSIIFSFLSYKTICAASAACTFFQCWHVSGQQKDLYVTSADLSNASNALCNHNMLDGRIKTLSVASCCSKSHDRLCYPTVPLSEWPKGTFRKLEIIKYSCPITLSAAYVGVACSQDTFCVVTDDNILSLKRLQNITPRLLHLYLKKVATRNNSEASQVPIESISINASHEEHGYVSSLLLDFVDSKLCFKLKHLTDIEIVGGEGEFLRLIPELKDIIVHHHEIMQTIQTQLPHLKSLKCGVIATLEAELYVQTADLDYLHECLECVAQKLMSKEVNKVRKVESVIKFQWNWSNNSQNGAFENSKKHYVHSIVKVLGDNTHDAAWGITNDVCTNFLTDNVGCDMGRFKLNGFYEKTIPNMMPRIARHKCWCLYLTVYG